MLSRREAHRAHSLVTLSSPRSSSSSPSFSFGSSRTRTSAATQRSEVSGSRYSGGILLIAQWYAPWHSGGGIAKRQSRSRCGVGQDVATQSNQQNTENFQAQKGPASNKDCGAVRCY